MVRRLRRTTHVEAGAQPPFHGRVKGCQRGERRSPTDYESTVAVHSPLRKRTDVVTFQVTATALAAAADEMATTLFRTAHSTVVRDCLDFSTALANKRGELVAQAVTVPLHLGSVPAAMAALSNKFGGQMNPGDVFVMNDPFDGGMHLPDIFVFRPIFAQSELVGTRRLFPSR